MNSLQDLLNNDSFTLTINGKEVKPGTQKRNTVVIGKMKYSKVINIKLYGKNIR